MRAAGAYPRALLVAACFSVVALGVLVLGLPMARSGCCLTPDAVEYLAVAHGWVEGSGFVNPILFTYYLPDVRPPVPSFAIRAPGLSVLLAGTLSLGAGVADVLVWHAVWAALIGGGAVLAARRAMPLPAALGFGIAVAWSPAWMFVVSKPLTEATAVGVLLLSLAGLRAGTKSVRGALLFSLLTLCAWMVRPNLALILPAALLAAACELGPRAALRSRPLWVYLGAFVLMHRAVVLVVTEATGFAPYAHYGVMAEIIRTGEVFHYQREYVGWLAFVASNTQLVLESVWSNVRESADLLLRQDFFLWVGWLAPPALVFALWRPGEHGLERRFAAFAMLGFTLVAVSTYGGFVAERYLLLGTVAAWLVVMSMLSAASRWLPAALAAALFLLQEGTSSFTDPWPGWQTAGDRYPPICRSIDPDALVASENPWSLYLWCGNAGLRLPTDLEDLDALHRYLDEQQPGYVLAPVESEWAVLRRSPRLERIGILHKVDLRPPLGLYEVVGAGPASRTWRAPPPLGRRARPERGPAALVEDERAVAHHLHSSIGIDARYSRAVPGASARIRAARTRRGRHPSATDWSR